MRIRFLALVKFDQCFPAFATECILFQVMFLQAIGIGSGTVGYCAAGNPQNETCRGKTLINTSFYDCGQGCLFGVKRL